MPVNRTKEQCTEVFLESGTACAGTEDRESARQFEEPHSSSSIRHTQLSVRVGVTDPGRIVKWYANGRILDRLSYLHLKKISQATACKKME